MSIDERGPVDGNQSGPEDPVTYDGFISYSHAADGLLAPRLQLALQRFAKPWWKRRAVRMFRDESSLSANPHLWSSITEALDTSGWFVLLLSPDAAESEWVNQEIAYWVEHRDPKKILPVVTDGEFGWAGDVAGSSVPETLQGVFSEEPRWVDLRGADTDTELDLQNPAFAAAVADIASSIRGVPKDDLASEEVRQHRRTVRTAWAAGIVTAALAVAAVGFGVQSARNANEAARQASAAEDSAAEAQRQAEIAQQERDVATEERDRADQQTALAETAAADAELATLISRSAALRGEDAEVSVLLALEAHRRSPGPMTEQAVLNALGAGDIPNRLSSLPLLDDANATCPTGSVSPRGTHMFSITADGILVSRDSLTGVVTEHGPSPDPCIGGWIADFEQGYGVVVSRDAPRMWIGPIGGPWEIVKEFDQPTIPDFAAFGLEGRIPLVTLGGDAVSVILLDAVTGDPVGTPAIGGRQWVNSVASDDGSLWAVTFGTPNTAAPDGTTLVIDAFSGEERFRFSSEEPAATMAFDLAANELVAVIRPQTLMTVDLDSGEVVSAVELNVTSTPLDIGIRPDGLVTVVASGEAVVVDRRQGVPLSERGLRDVLGAWIRPDGRLFTLSAGAERVGVIDLEGSALVQTTLPVDPFAKTTFNEGLVTAFDPPASSTVEVIDLATGERSVVELQTPDGQRYTPRTVYPDPGGVWAIDQDGLFTRWEDGQLVEQFNPGGVTEGGTRLGDLYGHVFEDDNGNRRAALIDLGSSVVEVLFEVFVEDAFEAHPTPDGGMVVIDDEGLLSEFDAGGALISELATQAIGTGFITVDPPSGMVAVADREGAVTIIDLEAGEVETLPVVEPIANLGFGRGGLLAITGADGSVRLWDVVRNSSAGVAWEGSGATAGSPSWYDPETSSMWVASSGKLLNIPLDPGVWIQRACDVIGRDMTQDEWDRYVPRGGEVQSACG